MTCPATGFSVGVNATVTCKVNKADFDSVCILPATLIIFYFTSSNGVKTEWCSSSYKTCPNTGTTQVACGTCSCGCETDDGTFLTHRLDFIPTSAHAAGSFSCEVICLNSGNLPVLTNNNCDQVKVGNSIVIHSSFLTSWRQPWKWFVVVVVVFLFSVISVSNVLSLCGHLEFTHTAFSAMLFSHWLFYGIYWSESSDKERVIITCEVRALVTSDWFNRFCSPEACVKLISQHIIMTD